MNLEPMKAQIKKCTNRGLLWKLHECNWGSVNLLCMTWHSHDISTRRFILEHSKRCGCLSPVWHKQIFFRCVVAQKRRIYSNNFWCVPPLRSTTTDGDVVFLPYFSASKPPDVDGRCPRPRRFPQEGQELAMNPNQGGKLRTQCVRMVLHRWIRAEVMD